jgi:hypothetical protein
MRRLRAWFGLPELIERGYAMVKSLRRSEVRS